MTARDVQACEAWSPGASLWQELTDGGTDGRLIAGSHRPPPNAHSDSAARTRVPRLHARARCPPTAVRRLPPTVARCSYTFIIMLLLSLLLLLLLLLL